MPREGKQNRSGKAAVLEPDELQNLFWELDDPYRAIAQLCYLTAGRIGEVLLLTSAPLQTYGDKWLDVHLPTHAVVFPDILQWL